MKIRITQDTEANATYVSLNQSDVIHSHTVELPNGMMVDYDTDGNIRGIEMLELVLSLEVVNITEKRG